MSFTYLSGKMSHAVPRPSLPLVARAHHETAIQDDPKPPIRASPEGRPMPPPLLPVTAARIIIPDRLRRVSPRAVLPTVDIALSIVRWRARRGRRRRDRSTLCGIRREEGSVDRRAATIFERNED